MRLDMNVSGFLKVEELKVGSWFFLFSSYDEGKRSMVFLVRWLELTK